MTTIFTVTTTLDTAAQAEHLGYAFAGLLDSARVMGATGAPGLPKVTIEVGSDDVARLTAMLDAADEVQSYRAA